MKWHIIHYWGLAENLIYWVDISTFHLQDLVSNPVPSKVTKDSSSLTALNGYCCKRFMFTQFNIWHVGYARNIAGEVLTGLTSTV